MHEWLAVIGITVLAVISPGPDFAMIARTSYLFGPRTGVIGALGIGAGVQVHVCYTVLGVALLVLRSPWLFALLKLLGAAYLVFMGLQALRSSWRAAAPAQAAEEQRQAPADQALSAVAAWRMGFFTNALNPKTMLFVVAVYTQVVHADTPLARSLGYGLFMSLAHIVWFSVVALFFSAPAMRRALLARQRWVDGVIGALLLLLGVSLLFVARGQPG
ncbi:lysine transporter LysE [Vandammella animalimorsus]|uniref:Lysine transporter LysE n=1 Tax=Vandammella animalimorsus TaxID=2029117 RepID=A0A2A2AYQ2_9BURK|nr:LysE family translocator [Vandammella animalimorsus]PAT32389.1 lysine transporter LysE [Vandammella animalimorsus]PAT34396.1 lysine transporter LysE [Vandammella animalimorsus]PAT42868.1 lysine transporter LysE [Vandammella animalimorsus]PAX16349.1 lysine transporter LysE [Vandammella animalimorsus]PAX19875.1 lysine transporter LysE [Vandammella animalimorsus]